MGASSSSSPASPAADCAVPSNSDLNPNSATPPKSHSVFKSLSAIGISACPVMNKNSAPLNPSTSSGNNTSQSSSPSACPVLSKSSTSLTPSTTSTGDSTSPSPSACPVMNKSSQISNGADDSVQNEYKNPNVYNVYSQKIDPTNQMPAVANQTPLSPKQEIPLSIDRTPSSIPKGGTTNDTWLYPSPQMFYNALVRKNKVDGAKVFLFLNMYNSIWFF